MSVIFMVAPPALALAIMCVLLAHARRDAIHRRREDLMATDNDLRRKFQEMVIAAARASMTHRVAFEELILHAAQAAGAESVTIKWPGELGTPPVRFQVRAPVDRARSAMADLRECLSAVPVAQGRPAAEWMRYLLDQMEAMAPRVWDAWDALSSHDSPRLDSAP